MHSCTAVLGLIFLVITDLAVIISFATPYWLEKAGLSAVFAVGFTGLATKNNYGLWALCAHNECVWVFEDKSATISTEDWFRATQGLMAVGLGVALIALIVATLSLCCQCRDCNYAGFVAGLLLTCFLSIGVAVTLFGIKASHEFKASIKWNDDIVSMHRFGWSYWLAVGAAGMSLLTSVIYGCAGRSSS